MSPLRSIAVISIAAGLLLAPGFADGFGEAGRGADEHQASRRRPDVILVLTDQQRADAFGAAGAADLRTPVMDRLAREGVVFTRAFTATPQCSPSRAALMTGRYPHRTGVMGNTVDGEGKGPPPAGMSGPLDRSLPTLGRLFAAAGYETAYFGKWHLGGSPGDYGFQTHDSQVHDPTLASRVVAYLRKRAADETRPLLLIVSWLNPHDIYGVLDAPPPARAHAVAGLPSNLVDDLRAKPSPQRHYLEEDQGKPFVGADRTMWRRYRAFYNELVETADREIGAVLGAVAPGDVPPITVFSADHGDLGGAHGLPYKGPAMYEELVRIPLVISWPGRIRAARSDALVSLIDLLPTLCDLTGVTPPADVDGLSLRPVLGGQHCSEHPFTHLRSSCARDGFCGVLREAVVARPDPDDPERAMEVRAIPGLRRGAVQPRRGSRRAAKPGRRGERRSGARAPRARAGRVDSANSGSLSRAHHDGPIGEGRDGRAGQVGVTVVVACRAGEVAPLS